MADLLTTLTALNPTLLLGLVAVVVALPVLATVAGCYRRLG